MKQQFVVVGLGMFGIHVARTLYEAGGEVIALDRDREAVQRARDNASKAMVADVTNKEFLKSLGLTPHDVVIIAMGESLEASILATLYFKEIGIRKIIAKANQEDHGKILSTLGASEVVFPEKDVAIRLARRISTKNIIDYIPFVEDMIENKVELIIDPEKVIKDSEMMVVLGKNSDLERVKSL
jgi:trk system potassium uptake protein TrkA